MSTSFSCIFIDSVSVTCPYITAVGVLAISLFFLCCALTRVIARTSVHMKMSRRAETATAAAVPATAAVLKEEPLLEIDVVKVLCWVGVVETIASGRIKEGDKMEVVDRSSKEFAIEVVEMVKQLKVPAGYSYMNTQRIYFFKLKKKKKKKKKNYTTNVKLSNPWENSIIILLYLYGQSLCFLYQNRPYSVVK